MPEHVHDDPTQTQAASTACPRLRLAAVAVIVVAAVAAGVFATNGHGGSAPKLQARSATTEQVVSALLAGVQQRAGVLGRPSAPVTLQWFGDLECPFCKKFALGVLPAIIRKWVRGGQLKIAYRSMRTATRQPQVFETQQIAALAAGAQDRMWNFVETFYREQGAEDSNYVTESYLEGIATQIPGLDLARWMSDRGNPELVTEMAADRAAVEAAGLRGTPAFLIRRTGVKRVFELENVSLTDPTSLSRTIEKILKLRPSSPGAHGARDLKRSPAPPPAAAA
jgi:protein-disulfide isomerase